MSITSHDGLVPPLPSDALGLETQRMRAALEARVFGAVTFPARLGRFVVLDRVGEGGMGTVWAAHDPELDRRIAIKVLHRFPAHGHAVARMRREAQLLARLDHPNVVVVHEVDTVDEHVYIAMEYLPSTLATWCGEHPPGSRARFRNALQLAIEAAHGLAAAHGAGLVHRDIKPSNLLIGDDRLRLADFGLARLTGDASEHIGDGDGTPTTDASAPLTAAGEIIGTPAYMAPEQIEGRADARADQFGLCATLWETFFGVRPFAGATLMERAQAIASGRPLVPAGRHDVPAWVRAVLRRGLAQDPAARWPDVSALARALERGRDRARRRGLVGIGVASIGGIVLALGIRHTDAARRCGDGPERLAPAWSTEREQSIARIHAAEVVHELDAFVGRWTALYDETCPALAQARAISRDAPWPTAISPRLACLADARDQLHAIVDVLEGADAEEGATLVGTLPPLTDCEDRDVMTAVTRDAALDFAAPRLARAHAKIAMQRFAAAETELADLSASSIDSALVAGRVALLHASIDHRHGDHARAAEHATSALGFAERARERELEVLAWLQLFEAARAQGQHERAAFFAERADTLASWGSPTSIRDAARQAVTAAAAWTPP